MPNSSQVLTQFDISLKVEQDICAAQSSVDYAFLVEVFQALGNLFRYCGNFTLGHVAGKDQFMQRASVHVFEYKPDCIVIKERIKVCHNIGMLERLENGNVAVYALFNLICESAFVNKN